MDPIYILLIVWCGLVAMSHLLTFIINKRINKKRYPPDEGTVIGYISYGIFPLSNSKAKKLAIAENNLPHYIFARVDFRKPCVNHWYYQIRHYALHGKDIADQEEESEDVAQGPVKDDAIVVVETTPAVNQVS